MPLFSLYYYTVFTTSTILSYHSLKDKGKYPKYVYIGNLSNALVVICVSVGVIISQEKIRKTTFEPYRKCP